MKGTAVFATCSYPDYNPELGGLPVRSSNGSPRYKLKYPPHAGHLLPVMRSTFPQRTWVKASADSTMPREEFTNRYRELITNQVDQIRAEAAQVRTAAGVDEDTQLVLMCFCRLHQPAKYPYCHRTIFAAVWRELTGEEVPEYAPGPPPETAAQQAGLF